ncbi:MAG: DUF2971 domain-containing protein [Firmicutes bacterium]|nr:DUF2971 domain-containing protein [Bacillota bacterium]
MADMETDFNIEDYRTEHSMDYLIAMELILNTPYKVEAFQTLYGITRLHIPNILYKYYSLSDNDSLNESKIETLRNEKVYMSDIKSLNDPFDNKAYFYKYEELRKYKELHAVDGRIIDDLSSFSRVSSFTANGINCMPMWAHYSNNHQGFCVLYDMKNKNNTKLSGCMFPIQYSTTRIDITSIMDEQVQMVLSEKQKQMAAGRKEIIIDDLTLVFLISYLGNIKHETWSYEKEYRCTAGATAKGMPFITAIPQKLYIGKDCSPRYIKKLIDVAFELNIPVFQMIFNEYDTNYNLTAKKIL